MTGALPPRVLAAAEEATVPAYVHDLPGLDAHAAAVRAALPGNVEVFYAAKANPDPELLRTLSPHVDGFEVASGGELAHVRAAVPGRPLAFGGPGKTAEELEFALDAGTARFHVESPRELARLAGFRREAGVLLRANPDLPVRGTLLMNGPFGMDAEALAACAAVLADAPWITAYGHHVHLASGLDAAELLELAARVTGLLSDGELNLGGGMAVDYGAPGDRFDWAAYGSGLAAYGRPLRIEPGRALTAYCGYYVTDVLDVKRTRGAAYAILRGGTHHLRTPATKGHDQPFAVLPRGPAEAHGPVTLVGQLCTPKDVLATAVPVEGIATGDRVVFTMAGAYAWNISHHDFLMHPKPSFGYIRE